MEEGACQTCSEEAERLTEVQRLRLIFGKYRTALQTKGGRVKRRYNVAAPFAAQRCQSTLVCIYSFVRERSNSTREQCVNGSDFERPLSSRPTDIVQQPFLFPSGHFVNFEGGFPLVARRDASFGGIFFQKSALMQGVTERFRKREYCCTPSF